VRLTLEPQPPQRSSKKSAPAEDPLAAFNSEASETGEQYSLFDVEPAASEGGQYSAIRFTPEIVEEQVPGPPSAWQPHERWKYFPASPESGRLRGRRFRVLVGMVGLAVIGAGSVAMLNMLSDRAASRTADAPFVAPESQEPLPELPGQSARLATVPRPSAGAPPPAVAEVRAQRRDVQPPPAAPRSRPQRADAAPPIRAPRTVAPPQRVDPAPRAQSAPPPRTERADAASSPRPTPPAAVARTPIDTGLGSAVARVDNRPQPPVTPAPAATTGVTPIETAPVTRVEAPAAASPAAPSPAVPPPAAPSPAAPPAAAAAGGPLPPAGTVTAASAIEAVLGRYASAFNSLDAQRAKAVWPTVNERNLDRAFDGLEQQQFDLGDCDIRITAPKAIASCDGTARFTPKVGSRKMRVERRQWTFRLQATGQSWTIESVDSR
jgi:hypothetical protein